MSIFRLIAARLMHLNWLREYEATYNDNWSDGKWLK